MRRQGMAALAAELQENAQHLQRALAESDWRRGFYLAKDAARAAGVLLQRLQILQDLEEERG